jgi:hypothetical protein
VAMRGKRCIGDVAWKIVGQVVVWGTLWLFKGKILRRWG